MRGGTPFSLVATTLLVAGCGGAATEPTRHHARAGAQLSLTFAPNAGQAPRSVRYLAQAGGTSAFFTRDSATLVRAGAHRGLALRLRFVGTDGRAQPQAGPPDGGVVNYLVGDHRRWRRDLPTSRTLTYRRLWPGIDLVFSGRPGALKYELHVAAGADVGAVHLAYGGARGLALGPDGSLLVDTSLGTLRDTAPVSYQWRGGRRLPVRSRYVLRGDGYGFALGAGYDRTQPLVIDPSIAYSTLLGGAEADTATAVAIDRRGSAFVTGTTLSPDYPVTSGAFDTSRNGAVGTDAFVTKLDPSGSRIEYSTLLGGTDTDEALGVAVDGGGSAYVTGQTWSDDFPSTGAFGAGGLGDAFAAKLSPDGAALEYSTPIGGSVRDTALGIALHGDEAYVTGYTASDDFPVSADAVDPVFNGTTDAFVTALAPDGSAGAYSTYVGGSGPDAAFAIAVDCDGAAYLTGRTASGDYPTTAAAFGPAPAGAYDAFVTKLGPAGSELAYSTLLGGGGLDGGASIAVDHSGTAFVTGVTSSPDYPTTPAVLEPALNGVTDAFVTALDADGSAPLFSTFLGGSGRDEGAGIAVGEQGVFVTGQTWSTDAVDGATLSGPADAFVAQLAGDGAALLYASLLGGGDYDAGRGVALGPRGRAVYVAGETLSADFPTTAGAVAEHGTGGRDGFVTKLALDAGNDD
jgi:hypothetical protein